MKKILFQKRIDPEKRTKTFSIHSRVEDQQCRTRVEKSFTYAIVRVQEGRPKCEPPLVFIRKSFDAKRGIEEFGFHVKGYFYVTHKGALLKVRFYHTLDIEIRWKVKSFSPKKSASLT